MKLLRASAISLLSLVLCACNSNLQSVRSDESLPGLFSVRSANFLYVGSAVQWNEHYAVTAAHIPQLENVAYRCSTGCDLVFIRRDAKGNVPRWRPSQAGEPVKTAGVNQLLTTVKGLGVSIRQRVRLSKKGDRGIYALSNAPVAEGMSGGPVYGPDNAVIGMIVGIFEPFSLGQGTSPFKNMSTYVPFEVIQHEWALFARRTNAERDSAPPVVLASQR